MKKILFLSFMLLASRAIADDPVQVYTTYDDLKKVATEFTNVYNSFQGKQFQIYTSTPVAAALQPGQFIIIATGTYSICTSVNSHLVCWTTTNVVQ